MPQRDAFRLPLLRTAAYRLNVGTLSQLPPDEGFEVAFAGRSNVGKSSTINAITDQKHLARASAQPGRTQQLVFFDIDDARRLVDLPGYGYARAPAAMRRQWAALTEGYIERRASLQGICLVMDIRHPFTDFDWILLDWARHLDRPVHVILNKADKLSRNAGHQILTKLRQEHPALSLQLFSAMRKEGLGEAHHKLAEWLSLGSESDQPLL